MTTSVIFAFECLYYITRNVSYVFSSICSTYCKHLNIACRLSDLYLMNQNDLSVPLLLQILYNGLPVNQEIKSKYASVHWNLS